MLRFGNRIVSATVLQACSIASRFYSDAAKLAVPILVFGRIGDGVVSGSLIEAALHCLFQAIGTVIGLATRLLGDFVHRGLRVVFVDHLTSKSSIASCHSRTGII